jgi:hypothetical protein
MEHQLLGRTASQPDGKLMQPVATGASGGFAETWEELVSGGRCFRLKSCELACGRDRGS